MFSLSTGLTRYNLAMEMALEKCVSACVKEFKRDLRPELNRTEQLIRVLNHTKEINKRHDLNCNDVFFCSLIFVFIVSFFVFKCSPGCVGTIRKSLFPRIENENQQQIYTKQPAFIWS